MDVRCEGDRIVWSKDKGECQPVVEFKGLFLNIVVVCEVILPRIKGVVAEFAEFGEDEDGFVGETGRGGWEVGFEVREVREGVRVGRSGCGVRRDDRHQFFSHDGDEFEIVWLLNWIMEIYWSRFISCFVRRILAHVTL